MIQSNVKSYISNIEIDGLNSAYSVRWPIKRGINIISGANGSGKSTLLQAISDVLKTGAHNNPYKPIEKIKIEFENGEVIELTPLDIVNSNFKMSNIDVVSTFDSALHVKEAISKLTDNRVNTDLDWSLYKTMERYLKYQLYIGKQAIELLLKGKSNDELKEIIKQKDLYFDILDKSLKDSHKKVVRDVDELTFDLNGIKLSPYQLSSGEKQLIIILTLALTQKCEPYVLIMDEPEISLHFEWQKSLLDNIEKLNPNVQIIASTHSPALIMQGWMSRVSDLKDLITFTSAQ